VDDSFLAEMLQFSAKNKSKAYRHLINFGMVLNANSFIMKKVLLPVLIGLLLFSCKTYRNVDNIRPYNDRSLRRDGISLADMEKLNPGDLLSVRMMDGKSHRFAYVQTLDSIVYGTFGRDKNPKTIEIPLEQIKDVRVKRINWYLTSTIPLQVLAGVLLGIMIAVGSTGT
jgi:hypothetical protein